MGRHLVKTDNRNTLHSVRTITLAITIASVFAYLFWVSVGKVALWPWHISLSISVLLSLITLKFKDISDFACGLISIICVTGALFASTCSVLQISQSVSHFEAFTGYRLAGLIFAVAGVRPLWAGTFVIGASGLVPVILYYSLGPAFQEKLALQEPWMTLMISVVSYVLYCSRIKSFELEKKLAHSKLHEESLSHLAKVFLALRDLSNTPIQTLKTTTAMLYDEKVPRSEIARLSTAALDQLQAMGRTLSAYEHRVNWSEMGNSFDAKNILDEVMEASKSDKFKLFKKK